MSEYRYKIDEIKERLIDGLCEHLENGMQNVDAQELAAVADAIKDIAEAKEKCMKADYYEAITEAMEISEYGEDYDEHGPRYYRGRNALGQYTHRKGYMKMDHDVNLRDVDRSHDKMYYAGKSYDDGYTDGHKRGFEEGKMMHSDSRYDKARKGYEDAKERGEEKEKRMMSLQEYLASISEDLSKKIMDMDPQEKQLVRNSLQSVQNKI